MLKRSAGLAVDSMRKSITSVYDLHKSTFFAFEQIGVTLRPQILINGAFCISELAYYTEVT